MTYCTYKGFYTIITIHWTCVMCRMLMVLASSDGVVLPQSPSGMMALWDVLAIIAAILSSMDDTEVILCPRTVAVTSVFVLCNSFSNNPVQVDHFFLYLWHTSYYRGQSLHNLCLLIPCWALFSWTSHLLMCQIKHFAVEDPNLAAAHCQWSLPCVSFPDHAGLH